MSTNPLKLLLNLQKSISQKVKDVEGNNKMNQMGSGLELYIRNLFIDSVNLNKDKVDYSYDFSYIGNSSNPPDLIIKNGDAIEIKKIESIKSSLALNSSNPKNKLYSISGLITSKCRDCEVWSEKDMLYIIGTVKEKILKKLWLVYGDCYCADNELYERIKSKLQKGIQELPNIEFSKTKELGKVKKIDPLGITDLRIRGMWNIENPVKVFSYLPDSDVNFLLLESKYITFDFEDRKNIENNSEIKVTDVKIKDPNNPANILKAKLIQLCLIK